MMLFDLLFYLLAAFTAAFAAAAVGWARYRGSRRKIVQRRQALEPVRKLAFEDVTAFGEDLAKLDIAISGHVLDEGATADYQRALDTYEAAKLAGDSLDEPDDIRHIGGIIADGRYAISCVRARVAGDPIPPRRPPCFFDPRHGPSVADVPYAPAEGSERLVPACALDTERIRTGAEPDTRKVLVGAARVPYWRAGREYEPYARGYFGTDPLTWLFVGSLAFDSYGVGAYSESGHSDGDAASYVGDVNGGDFGGGDF